MVDFFVAQAPPSVYVEGNATGVQIETFSVAPPEASIAPIVEQLKQLLATGTVQVLKTFLQKSYDDLSDLKQFNLLLLSANVAANDQLSVCMDVILKSLSDSPIIRLVDTKGDFCVVRFDR